MAQEGEDQKKFVDDRRSGKDRRTGKMDEKFKHAVSIGFFLELRKSDRRKNSDPDLFSLN